MIDQNILNVFQKVYTVLTNPAGKPITWAVTGSLGMVLHGMPLDIHDIDIQTDKEGAYEIEQRLVNHLVESVHFRVSDSVRSYFGVFEIDGVQVEVMGALQHWYFDGKWTSPVEVSHHLDCVDLKEMHIPVMSLAHEAEAYHLYGRTERAEMIKKFLLKNE